MALLTDPDYILADDLGAALEDSSGYDLSQNKATAGLFLLDGNANFLVQAGYTGYVSVTDDLYLLDGDDHYLTETGYGDYVGSMLYDAKSINFFVLEVNTYKQGTITPLRVSDLGYRTRRTDPGGVLIYPGLLDQAFELDRRVSLELTGTGQSTFGTIRIINVNQQYDAFSIMRNTNSRRVTLRLGQKKFDPNRGIYTDPSYNSLSTVFTGIVGSWLVGEKTIELPIKDTLFLADRPLQIRFYTGVGFIEGPVSFKGQPKPLCRGGTQTAPIQNMQPRLMDPVYSIYQWTDGPGVLVKLYENNAAVFVNAGDILDANDFYSTPTPPGSYRSCNAAGLFQLGSTAVGTISANVTGTCGGQAISTAAALIQAILINDLQIPVDQIDTASFYNADAAYPYTVGFHYDGSESASVVLSRLAASIGGRLLTSRNGKIGIFVPPRVQTGAVPVITFDDKNALSIEPIALPASLDPPPYRWRVSYQRNYTQQTSGYNPSATPARQQFIVEEFRYATWTDPDVQAVWLKPNDPSPVETCLLVGEDAQKVANSFGDQWRTLPRYFQVVLPIDYAVGLDIGSYVKLKWPLGELAYGLVGQIFGEQQRSGDSLITYEVIVNTATQSADQTLAAIAAASAYFTLDVSQLDVGILGDGVGISAGEIAGSGSSSGGGVAAPTDDTFYLDVSELDVGVLG